MLTAKEIEGLKGIVDSDYRDGDHPVGKMVWDWSANPFKSKRTFSGVMSSLNAKGFAHSSEYDKNEGVIEMTAAGWEALRAVEPEYCAAIEAKSGPAPEVTK